MVPLIAKSSNRPSPWGPVSRFSTRWTIKHTEMFLQASQGIDPTAENVKEAIDKAEEAAAQQKNKSSSKNEKSPSEAGGHSKAFCARPAGQVSLTWERPAHQPGSRAVYSGTPSTGDPTIGLFADGAWGGFPTPPPDRSKLNGRCPRGPKGRGRTPR